MRRPIITFAIVVSTILTGALPGNATPDSGGVFLNDQQLGSLRSLAFAHPEEFAGVALDQQRHEVRIHVPASRGEQPARRLLANPDVHTDADATAAAVVHPPARAGATDPATRWAVRFVTQRFSLAELEKVRERVDKAEPWIGLARPSLDEWYIDMERNVVAVGLTAVTPQLRDAARQAFGSLVELHESTPVKPWTREDDFAPWWGGARILPSGCTGGYVLRNLFSGQRALVTAAHCVALNQTITNSGEIVGTVSFWSRQQNGFDFAMITGQTYDPFVYTGAPNSAVGFPVRGGHEVIPNDMICFDGATTGQVCGARVTQVEVCKNGGAVTTCHLNVAQSTTGARLGQGGDSGGPVIQFDSVGLRICGHIIGGSTDGLTAYFHDILIPGFPNVGWDLDFVP